MSSLVRVGKFDAQLTFGPGAAGVTPAMLQSFKPFDAWCGGMDAEIKVDAVEVQSVDFFGKRMGFAKLIAKASLLSTPALRLPGIVFLRGPAVAVLLVLECDGVEYALLCVQPRLAIGAAGYREIPAGMLDDEERFGGVAAKELKEETGIELREGDMVELCALAQGANAVRSGLFPSVGACDEMLRLFYAKRYVSTSFLEGLQGKLCGSPDESEQIRLELVLYDALWRETDAKTLVAVLLRDKLRGNGDLCEAAQTAENTIE
jgi:ADP-sugar diphosphatase